MIGDFNAYPATFNGGVRVAGVDVNGDGLWDILTGPGSGLAPTAKTFRGNTAVNLNTWTGFDPAFLGGIYVGAARIV